MKPSRTILLHAPATVHPGLADRLRDPRATLVCTATAAQARDAATALRPFIVVCDLDALGNEVRSLLAAIPACDPAPFVFLVGSEKNESLAVSLLDAGDAVALFEDPGDIQNLDTLLQTAAQIAPPIDLATLDAPFPLPSSPALSPERYERLQILGEGATGLVWKARDHVLDMDVAIKILRDDLSQDDDAVRAMKAEARIAMELSHSNIVRLYNLVQLNGRACLVMEYIDGSSLEELLRRCGRFDPDFVIGVAASCAAGLDYAHRHGVLHRDLKPSNLLLTTRDTIKIIDFGVAGMLGKGTPDDIVGTPVYMPPEQLRGDPLGPTADLYALAIVVYQLLTGAVPAELAPFDPAHPENYRRGPFEGIPDAVRFVLERATAPDPADRYRTLAEFSASLRAALMPSRIIRP